MEKLRIHWQIILETQTGTMVNWVTFNLREMYSGIHV